MRPALAVVVVCVAVAGGFVLGVVAAGGFRQAGLAHQLREDEQPGPATTVTDGNVAFQVVAWRCGLHHVVGDHMPWMPDGRYCRIRIRAHNTDRPALDFPTTSQEVVDAAGRAHPVDTDAVQVSDQPVTLRLGLGTINELDLWFDVPVDAEIVAVRLRAREDSPGALIPLR